MIKKLILTLWASLLCLGLMAQGNVTTLSYRLSDFPDKQTQVVLSGNELVANALKQEVSAKWTASAFEFCTLDQFEARKTDSRYYFLIPLENQFKGEKAPNLCFLTLLKGGPEAAEGISAMQEIVSLPFYPTGGGSGRELVFAGALVQTIQEYVLAAMESERVATLKERWINEKYDKRGKMKQICMAREDLAPSVTEDTLNACLDEDFSVSDADQVDEVYLQEGLNTLVSYVVAPTVPEKGSWCYKMLIEADTHTIYYFARHKITDKKGAGFLPEDLKKLASRR